MHPFAGDVTVIHVYSCFIKIFFFGYAKIKIFKNDSDVKKQK